jgi:hypothetical protein
MGVKVIAAIMRNRIIEETSTTKTAGITTGTESSRNSNAAIWEANKKDSSIDDFSTYADAEEGVCLLIQNGFDGKNQRALAHRSFGGFCLAWR